jgi:MFS family permease
MIQLFGIVFFALTIPVSAVFADRYGRRATLLWTTVAIAVFGFALAPMLSAGTSGALWTMAIGLSLMGLTYGPLGTALSELFPTSVRYTGSSLTFNLAGIFGASLAPYAATWLAEHYGLRYVGYYLTLAASITLVGILAARETRDQDLSSPGLE